ncbi:hypothetical protein K402DRAFT_318136, partial [Aulographum hederae CBS 113979]
ILSRVDQLKVCIRDVLANDHFKSSQIILRQTTTVASTVDEQKYRETLTWISPIDFPAQQSDLIANRQIGTGPWFVNAPEFTNWMEGEKQTLFCPGDPGTGKTMLAATAIDHLRSYAPKNGEGLAYIFCDYKRHESQTAKELLSALLKQLLQGKSGYAPIRELLESFRKNNETKSFRLQFSEIVDATQLVVQTLGKAYIVIDALDECADINSARTDLIKCIVDLQTRTNLNFLVTSRFIPEVQRHFYGHAVLKIRASDDDKRCFIAGNFGRLPNVVQRNPDIKTAIQDSILRATDGMFLLARLHMDSLMDKTTKKSLRQALESLPKGSKALDQAYDATVARIDAQLPEHKAQARKVLSWITYARRPLAPLELCHALAVEADSSELDEDNLPDIEDMVSVCAGLVTVDEGSNIVRLVHYTTQEYLERIRGTWLPDAQCEIASTCLTYLSYQCFRDGPTCEYKQAMQRQTDHPFLRYTA